MINNNIHKMKWKNFLSWKLPNGKQFFRNCTIIPFLIIGIIFFNINLLTAQCNCPNTPTGSWSDIGGGSYTSSNGSETVTFTIATSFPAGVTLVGNDNMTTSNSSWFSESSIAGGTSGNFEFTWDTSPEAAETDIDLATDDKGSGTLTIDFGTTVTNPVLHLDRLGGSAQGPGFFPVTYITNSLEYSLQTAGVTLTRLSGTDDFNVVGNTIYRTPDVSANAIISESAQTAAAGTAAGSVQLNGTFQTVVFDFTGIGVEGAGLDALEFVVTGICPSSLDPADDCDGDGTPNGTDPNTSTPTATNDSGTATVGQISSINILNNDDYLDNSDASNLGTTSITDTGNGTAGGTIAFDASTGELDYTPLAGEAGTTVTVEYEVCNNASGTAVCQTAMVTISVAACSAGTDGPKW